MGVPPVGANESTATRGNTPREGRKTSAHGRDARALVAKAWCLYVLRCADGSLYCGITNDLARRFQQHSQGSGARYTRGRGPLTLLRTWPMAGKSAALKAEIAFKANTRQAKERLLAMANG